jgi:phosphatidylserine decarboxylase
MSRTGIAPVVDRRVKTGWLARMGAQEDLNFLLTNRVPRLLLTRLMGRVSRIQSRGFTRLAIGVWRRFSALDLSDARQQQFSSLHACFTRELVPGARPFATRSDVLASPSDAIVGACGTVAGDQVLQAKGMAYSMAELFGPSQDPRPFEGGRYVTLRLTSAMYHRFHAPHDIDVEHVTYLSGDTWNVNPIALRRIERLYCRNERAVLRARLRDSGLPIAIIPVAAILVASIRLHFLDVLLHLRRRGPNEMPCHARLAKGQEMGWFEHGSTIIVFAPPGIVLAEGVVPGRTLHAGQPLLRIEADRHRADSGSDGTLRRSLRASSDRQAGVGG